MFLDSRGEDKSFWTEYRFLLIYFCIRFRLVIDLPKYWNCATFSKHLLPILYHNFALHSGDQKATYTYDARSTRIHRPWPTYIATPPFNLAFPWHNIIHKILLLTQRISPSHSTDFPFRPAPPPFPRCSHIAVFIPTPVCWYQFTRSLHLRIFLFSFYPEDAGDTFLWNIG
jgi:hypothetical protein